MLPDTGIDDVKKQRNAEYAKHINDPVLSSLKMEGIRLLFPTDGSTECIFILTLLVFCTDVVFRSVCMNVLFLIKIPNSVSNKILHPIRQET
jgi:hypothetical protein